MSKKRGIKKNAIELQRQERILKAGETREVIKEEVAFELGADDRE